MGDGGTSSVKRITCATWLGELLVNEPEECRAWITMMLEKYVGNVSETARALEVSRPFLWYCMRKLQMNKVPAQIRDRWRARFRIT